MTPIKEHPTLGVLNSPQSVAAAYLLAWQYQDYDRLIDATQMTFRIDKEFKAKLAQELNKFQLVSFKVIREDAPGKGVNPMVQRHVVVDAEIKTVANGYTGGVLRYKVIMNCESKVRTASPAGVWGAYPAIRLFDVEEWARLKKSVVN